MVQGEHRMGLAAAEVSLQLDDRVAACRQPQAVRRRADCSRPWVRKVRRKKSRGLLYSSLILRPDGPDQVGGKLRLLEAPPRQRRDEV